MGHAIQLTHAKMINHARTLLMNIPGSAYQPQYLGEEYIPQTFQPVVLPSYIQTARRVLFGNRPERVFLNYRVRELLHTIHETELAEYVFALDPRVTYWPEPSTTIFESSRRVRITQTSGFKGAQLFVSGEAKPDHFSGVALREYDVRITQNEFDDYQLIIRYPDGKQIATTVDVSSGLSSPVSVAGTGLVLRVGGSPIFSGNLLMENGYPLLTEALDEIMLEVGNGYSEESSESLSIPLPTVFDNSAWRVSVFTPPSSVVGTLPLLEVIGAANIAELFGAGDKLQPMYTFRSIWFDHPFTAYRVAAFTLAMIYRTEQARRAQNG